MISVASTAKNLPPTPLLVVQTFPLLPSQLGRKRAMRVTMLKEEKDDNILIVSLEEGIKEELEEGEL